MTEQTPMPPDDHELEQFLARRSELSRLHRAAVEAEGAPPELDAPVLALAREALRHAPARRWQRWGRPLALAASLVLVVSLAWVAQQRPLQQEAVPTPSAAATAPVAYEASPAPADAPSATAASREQQADQVPSAPVAANAKPDKAPRGLPQSRLEQQRKSSSTQAQSLAPVEVAPAVDAALPKTAARQESDMQAQSTLPQAAPPSAAAPATPPLPAAALPAVKTVAAPAPAPAPMPQAAGAPAPLARISDVCSAPQDAAASGQTPAAADAAWLERIRRLRDAQKPVAARAELACFNRSHAPEQVPDDLRPLLQGAP